MTDPYDHKAKDLDRIKLKRSNKLSENLTNVVNALVQAGETAKAKDVQNRVLRQKDNFFVIPILEEYVDFEELVESKEGDESI